MPLKLVDPRPGRSPNYTIRGTYLRVYVDTSTGTSERKTALKALEKIKRDIERGAYAPAGTPTFASAALAYMNAGGDRRFLKPLLLHFGETPLDEVAQQAIDMAAAALYPNGTAATRNRQVYTPVSAILRHAGAPLDLRRPKGAQGQQRLSWLAPEAAGALLDAAAECDPEFGAFLTFLLYTGCRLSEGLNLLAADVDLQRATAFVRETKNGAPRMVHLPPIAIAALANLNVGHAEYVFRFGKNGRLYTWFKEVCAKAGVPLGPRDGFHMLRHTYGAWMRRHAGLDTSGLVATGAWKSRNAAALYEHADVTEEARKADLLPVRRGKSVE